MVTAVRTVHPSTVRASGVEAASLPCRRRPDVFSHPLLMNPPSGVADLPIQTRRLQALEHAAGQLCGSCPVRQECLREAVLHEDPGGYAAGTTQQDRRLIRRRLGVGTPQGDPVDPSLLRHRAAELDFVLDALTAMHPPRPHRSGDRPAIPQQKTHPLAEVAMAPPAGERITFPLDDPVLAVRKAVLAPLLRATRTTLDAAVRLAGMLVHAPSAGLTPPFLDACRDALRLLTAWEEATGEEGAEAVPHGARTPGPTGSVAVELAVSDPIAALRQDVFDPLLRRLLASIGRVEEVVPMLVNEPLAVGAPATAAGAPPASDAPGGPLLGELRAALRALTEQIRAYQAADPARASGGTAGPGGHAGPDPYDLPYAPHGPYDPFRQDTARPHGTGRDEVVRMLRPAPSLRRAVERTAAAFPGPFTARDVLLSLPPGTFRESGKSISNVLSAMVGSGTLRRVSRGTYTATGAVPGSSAALS